MLAEMIEEKSLDDEIKALENLLTEKRCKKNEEVANEWLENFKKKVLSIKPFGEKNRLTIRKLDNFYKSLSDERDHVDLIRDRVLEGEWWKMNYVKTAP